jgi:hypothetical protein
MMNHGVAAVTRVDLLFTLFCGVVPKPVNTMFFIWNDNKREKREANANAT